MLPKESGDGGVPRVTRPQNIARLPDVVFQRRVIEPAFRLIGGHAPIKSSGTTPSRNPSCYPPKERVIYDVAVKASEKRERTLIYVGSYRPNKGQLDFPHDARRRLGPTIHSSSACARRTSAAMNMLRFKRS